MPKASRRLTRAQVVRALTRLGELCTERKARAEIAIYGGTVMMFAYDCRKATKDVDAIFHPSEVVEPLIVEIAAELHLPVDWMNSGVQQFVAPREKKAAFEELQIPGLLITRPTPEYLLAMKCMAARLPTPFRAGDIADIKFLMRKLGLKAIKQVEANVGAFYGSRRLDESKRWLIEQLLAELKNETGTAE